MRVFSPTIAVDVLRLVDDGRDGSEVAMRMGGSNGEKMKSRRNQLWGNVLGYCLGARPLSHLYPLFDQSTSGHRPRLFLWPNCHGNEYHVGSVSHNMASMQPPRLFTRCAREASVRHASSMLFHVESVFGDGPRMARSDREL